jgi:diaminopimelate epimerase
MRGGRRDYGGQVVAARPWRCKSLMLGRAVACGGGKRARLRQLQAFALPNWRTVARYRSSRRRRVPSCSRRDLLISENIYGGQSVCRPTDPNKRPMLSFTKMNGAGNDFVLLDNRSGHIRLNTDEIAFLCDRHRGIGGDGVLLLENATNGADFRMRYYNSDGGEAEMCGNGARCFARFANKVAGPFSELSFETPAGIIRAKLNGEQVTVNLSPPHGLALNRKLQVQGEELTVHLLNTGVPHVVVIVDELEATPVYELGKAIRYHSEFHPKGTNVNFVKVIGPGEIAIRTYERGVEAETLACGTGVTASALVYSRLESIGGPIRVHVLGGDWLEVAFVNVGEGFRDVALKGPADFAFEGAIELS